MLIMEAKGLTKSSMNSINRLVGRLFGPEALEHFILPMACEISLGVQGCKNKLLLLESSKYDAKLRLDSGILLSIEEPMSTKKSFNDSAKSILEFFPHFYKLFCLV